LYNIDTKSLNQISTGDHLVSVSSTGQLGGSFPLIVPPSPSSALDMHKVTLRAAQNHLAIKKMEEKNDHLQKEIDQLRQDVDLLKKLVVSLDLQQKGKKEDEEKTSKAPGTLKQPEKTISKTKSRPKSTAVPQPKIKSLEEEDEDDSAEKTTSKKGTRTPRDEKSSKQQEKNSQGQGNSKGKKSTKSKS